MKEVDQEGHHYCAQHIKSEELEPMVKAPLHSLV